MAITMTAIWNRRRRAGVCIEDTVYVHNGVRILGLGGSMRYNSGVFQYTEWQMRPACEPAAL